MLIHLSSFCQRSKTRFWSRKTSGQGLSEHRKCKTIILNHKLGKCGGGADQNRSVCIWWRCTFQSLPQATQPCPLHLPMASTWEGEAQEEGKVSHSSLPKVAGASIWAQKCLRDWTHCFSTSGGRSLTIRDVLANELYLSFFLQNRWT